MSYVITRTNGTTLVEIADQTVDTTTTSLSLIGRGAPQYGQAIAEDFVHLLENFAAPTAPGNPMVGQLWYDTTNQVMKVYNGTTWKLDSASDGIGDTGDQPSGPTLGGNTGGDDRLAGAIAIVLTFGLASTTVVAFFAEGKIVAILSAETISANVLPATVTVLGNTYQLASRFPNGILAGLQLATDNAGYLFGGTSTSSEYADVAERYETSEALEPGDVVEIGGDKEIRKSSRLASTDVFGIVSTQPAYLLNAAAGTDETHPPIALTGRVPVKVTGTVKKGQRLIASNVPGVALAVTGNADSFAVLGRALEDKTDAGIGLVEAYVGGVR
jgi:hypothetical protein